MFQIGQSMFRADVRADPYGGRATLFCLNERNTGAGEGAVARIFRGDIDGKPNHMERVPGSLDGPGVSAVQDADCRGAAVPDSLVRPALRTRLVPPVQGAPGRGPDTRRAGRVRLTPAPAPPP